MTLSHAELAAKTDAEIEQTVRDSRPKYLHLLQVFILKVDGKVIMGGDKELIRQVIHHVRNEQPVPARTDGMG